MIMKYNIIPKTLLLSVLVMVFPSLTYAYWSAENPPNTPPENQLFSEYKTCEFWIGFSGLSLFDEGYADSLEFAENRDPQFDRYASIWAAMYVFRIGSQYPPEKLTPADFCISINQFQQMHLFEALGDAKMGCPSWIQLYGFIEYNDENNSVSHEINQYDANLAYARAQLQGTMLTTSNYVYSYYKYIMKKNPRNANDNPDDERRIIKRLHNINYNQSNNQGVAFDDDAANYVLYQLNNMSINQYNAEDYYVDSELTSLPTVHVYKIKPSDFCQKIGFSQVSLSKQMPFVNFYGPDLTCHAWIGLYGYSSHKRNIDKNFEKAHLQIQLEENEHIRVHDFVRGYTKMLRSVKIREALLLQLVPNSYCAKLGVAENTVYGYDFTIEFLPRMVE